MMEIGLDSSKKIDLKCASHILAGIAVKPVEFLWKQPDIICQKFLTFLDLTDLIKSDHLAVALQCNEALIASLSWADNLK